MYERYVAIGDSQTEGVGDGDDRHGYRGWADRLAEQLSTLNPDMGYANLAIRGRRIGQIRAEQLEPAVRMNPDLATVVAGLNDILRPTYDEDAVVDHLDRMIGELTEAGAHVATVTFPDIGAIAPLARRLQPRLTSFNARIREVAAQHGATVVEADRNPVCTDRRMWSSDRLHLNSLGHERLCGGFAHALDVPGSDESWARPLPPTAPPGLVRTAAGEVRWAATFLAPWLWRRITGRSSGDGRSAKRPQLQPLA